VDVTSFVKEPVGLGFTSVVMFIIPSYKWTYQRQMSLCYKHVLWE